MSEPKETGREEKETDRWETRERVEQNDGERKKEKMKWKELQKNLKMGVWKMKELQRGKKDASSYGVQQRKRMLRPRDSQQTTTVSVHGVRTTTKVACVSLSYAFILDAV